MAQITKPADLAAHTTYSCGSAIVALSEGDVATAIDHLTREHDLLEEMGQGQSYVAGIPDDFNPIVFAANMTYAQGAALVALCKGAVSEALEVLEVASSVSTPKSKPKPKPKRTTRKPKPETKPEAKPEAEPEAEQTPEPKTEQPESKPEPATSKPKAKSAPEPAPEPAPAPAAPAPTPQPVSTESEPHVDIDPTDDDPWASSEFSDYAEGSQF